MSYVPSASSRRSIFELSQIQPTFLYICKPFHSNPYQSNPTTQHVRPTHGHGKRRRANAIRRRPHFCRAAQQGGGTTRWYVSPSPLLNTIQSPSHSSIHKPNTHISAKNVLTHADPSTHTKAPTSSETPASGAPNTHGITPADKIRYGQSIQESGMGGKTTSSTGEANAGGFGGTEAMEGSGMGASAAQERRQQGYGGDNDMDTEIGG
jgi:hypothetical protein